MRYFDNSKDDEDLESAEVDAPDVRRQVPGKIPRTMPVQEHAMLPGKVPRTVQLREKTRRQTEAQEIRARAAQGVTGSGERLPHYEEIQKLFGKHDVSNVRAHRGSQAHEAAESVGADAYAFGDDVVFGASDDLHTAAHEAAHVVQQRAGIVELAGGVGRAGDEFERHADEVADAVVSGRSAETVLDRLVGGTNSGAATPSVQRTGERPFQLTEGEIRHGEIELHVATSDERGEAPGDAGDYVAGSNVRISREGDEIFLTAPLVTWQATVALTHPERLVDDDFVTAGPIQTLISSNRVGVYKDENGRVVAEQRTSVSNARDAMTASRQRVNPPFYGDPEMLSESEPSATVSFYDSPRLSLPAQIESGTLREVRGEDRFTLSLGVKHEDTILHLAPHNWSVPWSARLTSLPNSGGSSRQGGAVAISETEEGHTPPGGPIVAEQSQLAEHVHYPSAEAASHVDYWTLVSQLEAAQRNDPASAGNIVAGMLLQNPRVSIKIQRVGETLIADDMVLHAWGVHRAVRTADVSRDHIFHINLRELFHNRNELTSSSTIGCTLFDEDQSGGSTGGRVSFAYPFEPGEPELVTASGIHYTVQLLGFGTHGRDS